MTQLERSHGFHTAEELAMKSKEKSGGLFMFFARFFTNWSQDKTIFPAPVCNQSEVCYEEIRDWHYGTKNRRGVVFHAQTGTPVLQRKQTSVFGLPIWIDNAPNEVLTRVAIKNPRHNPSSEVGEWNALVRFTPPGTRKPILFFGMQVSEGVHVIRPVTRCFQKELMPLVAPGKKNTLRK